MTSKIPLPTIHLVPVEPEIVSSMNSYFHKSRVFVHPPPFVHAHRILTHCTVPLASLTTLFKSGSFHWTRLSGRLINPYPFHELLCLAFPLLAKFLLYTYIDLHWSDTRQPEAHLSLTHAACSVQGCSFLAGMVILTNFLHVGEVPVPAGLRVEGDCFLPPIELLLVDSVCPISKKRLSTYIPQVSAPSRRTP